jgi:hypothetical protein
MHDIDPGRQAMGQVLRAGFGSRLQQLRSRRQAAAGERRDPDLMAPLDQAARKPEHHPLDSAVVPGRKKLGMKKADLHALFSTQGP